MNHPEKILLLFLIFGGALVFGASETDVAQLESQAREKTAELQQIAVNYQQLTGQLKALAAKISELKSEDKLSYFQRRQLEDYLKSSQEIANEIENLSRRIIQVRHELQMIKEQLVENYDQQISRLLEESEKASLKKSRKKDLLKQLTQIKQQRNTLQIQMEWEITESGKLNQIEIEENDTPRKIQVKADWLKDLENRLRTNAAKIDQVVLNLQDEIELRDKMHEFEQELSLFNHRDEARMAPIATVESQTEVFGEERGNPPELTTKGTGLTENASMLPLFPDLMYKNDFMNLTNADIQTVIDSLSRRKMEMLITADSLNKKAIIFYQKAEQAKSSSHQGKK